MTIDEAIESLTQLLPLTHTYLHKDYEKAVNLGIKALERFRNLRDSGKDVGMPLLKGETK
jgi:hypothetical protein